MNTSKLLFISKGNTVLGAHSRVMNGKKSVVFGFRSRKQVEYVKWHIKYLFDDIIEEMTDNRYLLKTRFNSDNIPHEDKYYNDIVIQSRNIYDSAVICGLNNISLSVVDHIYDRENDGDLELSCVRVKDLFANGPVISDEIVRYNLEMLYKNI